MMTDHPDSRLQAAVRIPFETRLQQLGAWPLRAAAPTILQMNLGYRCNQQCLHCHINAGPTRSEVMSPEVMEAALRFAGQIGIRKFDVTGGAPELHPHFRWLITAITQRGYSVTDRCNLTVLTEPGQEDLIDFLAAHRVSIMASFSHYTPAMTDRLRGDRVFIRSITALRQLNAAGYGLHERAGELVLVYNPIGAILPASQADLEAEFRTRLAEHYGIVFTRLIALANLPTGRFLTFLQTSGNLERYMARLERQFNAATLPNLMCRSLLSVGWDGTLYDCDFNQASGLAIGNGARANLRDTSLEALQGRSIHCQTHCYGCTAGQGSSCSGAVAPS